MYKRRNRIYAVLLAGTLLGSMISGGCSRAWAKPEQEALKVTLLKVGKADAIALLTKEKAMVIDAGEEEDGEELVTFLTQQGIRKVDTLIITHYDQDHVGGADTLIEEMEVGQVLLPAYRGKHSEYADFMKALEKKNITPAELEEKTEFEFGDAEVLVEPPLSYEAGNKEEMDNNFSLITTVTHGENRLIFTGDAQKQRIREWLETSKPDSCDFLKMPHHGVYNKALGELLDGTEPEYAAICSSHKNPAEAKTLELLKQKNVSVMETKDGDITVISDGKGLEIHQEREK